MTLTGKTYDTLKWIAQIFLPAFGALYIALAALWELPKPQEVAGTVLAVDTFLGVILGISQSGFNNQLAKGTIETIQAGDGKLTYSLQLDDHPETLRHKKRAVFDVVRNDEGLTTVELIGGLCLIGIIALLIVLL